MTATRVNGVVCLTGVGSGGTVPVDAAFVGRDLVMDNGVVVGSVNANRRHWKAGADALVRADRDWLARLVSRRVPMERFADALVRQDDDVKVVVDIAGS